MSVSRYEEHSVILSQDYRLQKLLTSVISSVCDSQYPPRTFVFLTSQNKIKASPSNTSVAAVKSLSLDETSKQLNVLLFPSVAVVSEEK